ncbi:peroxidase [Leifsonia xyli subsp. xyli]|uniref:Iron-dependent peroxidase n=2 Tax=Leifsonia xyli subsp. xyli TaxID=59736 RepID=Q6ACU4_LEIXX|nr:Dyp-type peroxidase [Leifsonia xyli]AAT89799.1 iron-dependent peroxidase [Leifsonia xyli subsp. xyli str. CTCB07]ODA90637.1 peroxidase [Leifsonia xyli subsp. xyli]
MTGSGPGGRVRRRQFLLGGAAVAGIGATSSLVAGIAAARPAAAPAETVDGRRSVAFHGRRQSGIETPPAAHSAFIALDLHPETDRSAIQRMLLVLSADAADLTRGEAALADTEPELATRPAGLTVTFGFGPGLVQRAGAEPPAWLRPLPAFGVDRLRDEWSHGDLLLHLASDDPLTLAHARRMLLKDARGFAAVRWVQTGFRTARGTQPASATGRNLFGQVDGTANPVPGSADFAELVWRRAGNPDWLHDGTGMVLRRIAMDVDRWDLLDRPGREEAVGRTLSTGAPITGGTEHSEPDFGAMNEFGFPVIPAYAHIRRARSSDTAQRIYRRGYNYDERPGSGVSDSGLLFVSYQADIDAQFVPLQRRLDQLDLMNQWTAPVGSAVFALPPGCEPGGYVGETLFRGS